MPSDFAREIARSIIFVPNPCPCLDANIAKNTIVPVSFGGFQGYHHSPFDYAQAIDDQRKPPTLESAGKRGKTVFLQVRTIAVRAVHKFNHRLLDKDGDFPGGGISNLGGWIFEITEVTPKRRSRV